MIVCKKPHSPVLLCLLLASLTAALYWPITGFGFINFDDHQYIYENPHVIPGLTWSGLRWSFQCGYAGNWHPLTWISHMIDCDLYGLNPNGHHLTNLLFHVANTVLLFRLFKNLTGTLWRSFFVAALFAWHPVHVESVAWASERKDVLFTFFGILTLMAYLSYCRKPSRFSYFLSLLLFALGLMSKPMLVTLPFILLLMDFWPLGRFQWAELSRGFEQRAAEMVPMAKASTQNPWGQALRLIAEKAPFFAFSLAASILTYMAQQGGGAVSSWIELPLGARCVNATISYLRYIAQAFWPAHLALLYPFPNHWPVGLAIAAPLMLGAITASFVLCARRTPCLIVGWLWFLGTLVPVIGLVQVGSQAMADRYMYFPGIGLSIVIIWGLNGLFCSRVWGQKLLAVVGAGALAGCCICTFFQLRYWQDPEKLYRHAIEVTTGNYVAYTCLAGTLDQKGNEEAALALFEKAIEIEPHYPVAQYDLGLALVNEGKLEQAVGHFASAAQDNPKMAEAHNNWGRALLDLGKTNEAAVHIAKAFSLQPDNPEIGCNMGMLLARQSKDTEAIARFADALRLKPEYSEALHGLRVSLNKEGGMDQAISYLSENSKKQPDNLLAHFSLGLALLEQNKPEEAETQFSLALQLDADDPGVHYYLATALIRQHKSEEAVFHYRKTLRQLPDNADALNGLAWILASDPGGKLRAGKQALRLAKQACEITRHKQPAFVITLAAAYAETGRFSEALAAMQQAHALALAARDDDAVARADELRKLFESHHTVADALSSGSSTQ